MSTSQISPHQIVLLSLIAERSGEENSALYSRADVFRRLSEMNAGMFKQALDNMLASLERRGLIDRFQEDRVDSLGTVRKFSLLKCTKKGLEVAEANTKTGKLERARKMLDARARF